MKENKKIETKENQSIEHFDIEKIESPAFLKELTIEQLNILCADIRTFIISHVSKTGGHLSSNLGAVEAIVAMHYVFDSPKDKFLFDVSHQSYTHKILTGRAKEFDTLRQMNGLSGFINYEESEHDVWESGHSSTTLAAAAGLLEAKEINKNIGEVVAFIGDGSIQNGIAFEGLNYIGSQKNQKAIIILNDNNMSISKNVGRLARRFSKIRIKKGYKTFKKIVPEFMKKHLIRVQNSMRSFVYGKNIFSSMGYKYYGPIDGHDLKELIQYFEFAKNANDALILQIVTKKGYGFEPAMNDTQGIWHGVGEFNPETGEIKNHTKDGMCSWSDAIASILDKKFETNSKIRLICPATMAGSKLNEVAQHYPDQVIDVGINEELACVMAASMSRNGIIPIVSIYSTFFQRCYDFINNDIARSNNAVLFLLDRCGIVGGDGSTHQGIFDISMITPIPNIILAQPKDMEEASSLLTLALESSHPFVLRYPKEDCVFEEIEPRQNVPFYIGQWEEVKPLQKTNIITYGPSVLEIKDHIELNKCKVGLINARFIKPIDINLLKELKGKHVIVYEETIKSGSLYSLLLEANNEHHLNIDFEFVGINNQYITSLGSKEEIKSQLSIDLKSLYKKID